MAEIVQLGLASSAKLSLVNFLGSSSRTVLKYYKIVCDNINKT